MRIPWPFSKDIHIDSARLQAIFISVAAGKPMQSVTRIRALAGTGLQGDRYALAAGHWQATDACQVTLISEDDLRRAGRRLDPSQAAPLHHGAHRRNLVLAGVRTRQLEGRTFRIGEAVFDYHKPRPPCGYLDQVEGRGLARALGRHSGVCLQVVESGELQVGDPVRWIDQGG